MAELVNTFNFNFYKYTMKIYKNAQDWTCKYCNAILKSRRKLYEHYIECVEKSKLNVDSLRPR